MKADYPETGLSYSKHTIALRLKNTNRRKNRPLQDGLPGDRVTVRHTNRRIETDGKADLLHGGGLSGDRVLSGRLKHTNRRHQSDRRNKTDGKTYVLQEGGLSGDRVPVQHTIAGRLKHANRRHGNEKTKTNDKAKATESPT